MACQTRTTRLRALVASVVALLFVAQTAFVQIAQARAGMTGDAGATVSATQNIAEICHGDHDGAPKNKGAPCSHCTLCMSGAREALFVLAPLRLITLLAIELPSFAPAYWPLGAINAPKPPGWTSSWSSRAPPVFS